MARELRTLLVAAGVCLVCSLVVSSAAVLLRPLQEAHQARERRELIAGILESVPGLAELLGGADASNLEARLVDLDTGEFVEGADPAEYDQRAAVADPERSVPIPSEHDLAGLGRRAQWAPVYLVRDRRRVRLVILPVHGQGYQSMLYGYVALDGDGETIRGLTFYEQGETPGLGSQVTAPAWLDAWPGTRVRGPDGELRVRVVQGEATSEYEVEGISGATWTGRGVTNLLRYWLGPHGFAPFLERITEEGDAT